MNEPVELPSSKAVMDRVVILRHLMRYVRMYMQDANSYTHARVLADTHALGIPCFSLWLSSAVSCSDSRDPFTRQPLTPDMLQPRTELQKEIAEWKLKQTCQEAELMHSDIVQDVEEKAEVDDVVEDLGDDEDLY